MDGVVWKEDDLCGGIMIWALYDIQQGTLMGVYFSSS